VSKSVLIGALVACVLAVGLIAVVTTTVIVDGDGGGRILRADGPFPGPGPGVPLPGPGGGPDGQVMPRGMGPKLRRMKECLQRQGATPGAVRPRAFRGCIGLPSLR
jgi:hypothetical protein